MRNASRMIGLILLIAVAAGGAFAEKAPLSLKVNPGDSWKLSLTHQGKLHMLLAGQPVNKDTSVILVFTLKAVEVTADGNVTFAAALDSIAAKENATIGDHEFNPFENQAGLSPLLEIARVTVDVPFQFTTDQNGHILDLAVDEDAQKRIAEKADLVPVKIADEMTDIEKEEFRKKILQNLDAESIRAGMAKFITILPSEPVEAGSSWELEPVKDAHSSVTLNRTMKVVSWEGDVVTIGLDGKAKSEPGKDEVDIEGEATATLTVDAKTGLCTRQEYLFKVKGTDPQEVYQDMVAEQKGVIELTAL